MDWRIPAVALLFAVHAGAFAGPHPAKAAWPQAVTVCLQKGVFLDERHLISSADAAVEQGEEAVRALFRERASSLLDDPAALRAADRIGPHLFIIAKERQHFSDIIREMRLPLDDDRGVSVRVRARADRFRERTGAWSVSATTTAPDPLTVTLVNRNHTVEQSGKTPLDLEPSFALSDRGEIRFTHDSGASTAIPTTLFLETLQRARKLCDS